MEIENIQKCIKINKYEISLHAQKERTEEEITIQEIEQAIIQGEIIEEYHNDQRGASCLIFEHAENKPIHIVCALLSNNWLRIITVYIPQMPKWLNPKRRKE